MYAILQVEFLVYWTTEFFHGLLDINNRNPVLKYIQITAQKVKFSIKDFFSKCDQIRSFL